MTSTANRGVTAARRLTRRRGRDRRDELLVSGPALHEARSHLLRVYASPAADPQLVARLRADGVEVVDASDDVVASLDEVVTGQGLVGVARLPRPSLVAAVDAALAGERLLVVADGVADPGNAGTLIRTADAAGADAVVLTSGSVDPRAPKVVRASAGSLFHLPVVDRVEPVDLVEICARAGIRLVGAAADAPTTLQDADLAGPLAVVVGNEAHGLSDVVRGALDDAVAVPMRAVARPGYDGLAESLNLAVSAAIVVYEAVRQRRGTSGQAHVAQGHQAQAQAQGRGAQVREEVDG